MRLSVVIGLLGLIAGLLIALVAGSGGRPVYAQGGAADGSALAVAANFNNGEQDLVWVFDAKAKVLSIYKYQNNTIELIGARNLKWDLLIPVPGELRYKGVHLSPSDVEKAIKKIIKEQGKKGTRKGG
jgi:hypothetical protein